MTLKTSLYEHQRAAVDKLLPLKIGALYMEMGTGKTRTALELIARRHAAGRIDRVLWLCPCSTLEDIRMNISYHADGAEPLIHMCGLESISQSPRIYGELMACVEGHRTMLVIDESDLVKNHLALRTKRIEQIRSKCAYRLILNGTPTTKSEVDLFAQWYLLDPRVLGYNSFYSFAANHIEYDEYGKPQRCLNINYLTTKIAPYSFQIKKDECFELPDITREYSSFSLTENQAIHYEGVRDRLLEKVDEFDETTIYRLLTALQLVCSGRFVYGTHRIRSEPFLPTRRTIREF
jgi:SNF2 family DNA or RNA helicase